MTRPSILIGTAAMAFFAAAATAQSGVLDVRAVMQEGVNPAMLAIWEVSNGALNDEGGIDPALVNDAQWERIASAADEMAAAGNSMASANRFIAAASGNTAVGDGEISMADVQRHIDTDPAGLKQMAAAFAEHANRLSEAARAKDVVAAGDLITEMDAVCETCHSRYWYPE